VEEVGKEKCMFNKYIIELEKRPCTYEKTEERKKERKRKKWSKS
jgi:hypothetical protein